MKKFSIQKNNQGFTLAEILVVIAVLSILGLLVVTIFSRTLRGSNKSQILSAIKQNGQAILGTMDKTIRDSDNLVCISSNPDNTIVIVRNGIFTRYRFVPDSTGLNNGVVWIDNPIQGTQETDPRLFINRVCNPSDPLTGAQTFSDTNPQSGVNVLSGSFSKSVKAGFRDIITIEFTLGPGIEAPKAVAGQIDPATFHTTIELR